MILFGPKPVHVPFGTEYRHIDISIIYINIWKAHISTFALSDSYSASLYFAIRYSKSISTIVNCGS